MPGTAGWCYTWHIRWDTATNCCHVIAVELPHCMLVALLNHTTASFSCSTIGLDGPRCSHTKNLHLKQNPDLSGVWRTQWVSRTPGAPEEECWCAHRTWRESVNALQTCGHKPPEKRRLPEGPDPKADWVTKEKIRLARNASELLEGADSRTLTKEMSNDTLSDVTVQLTPQDHRLLQNIRPDILAMLQRMSLDCCRCRCPAGRFDRGSCRCEEAEIG